VGTDQAIFNRWKLGQTQGISSPHLDRRQFLQKLSFTHSIAGILVSIETVQNPTRNGDPIIKRQLRFQGPVQNCPILAADVSLRG